MTEDAIDALLEAVDSAGPEGVTAEGLHVAKDDGTYRLGPPEQREEQHGDEEGSDKRPRNDRLSEAGVRSALADHSASVREWYYWNEVVPDVPHASDFLRWLEAADDTESPARPDAIETGVSRTWGQLLLTVSPGESGGRAYEVRHVADAELPLESLERHTDPVEMREIARYDADGTYRPLPTAPTLRSGWTFVDLGPGALLDVVDRCYPATVANWHREREGELDVTHWRETAERQTGIYGLVDELEGGAVSALARACCVDEQCLKRREWDEYGGSERESDDGKPMEGASMESGSMESGSMEGASMESGSMEGASTDGAADASLDAPRGDGEFPCREPCSLVIAAAREFVKTERESPESVSVDLRPRELAQLERLIDAAADGELAGVGAGDLPDPANPLRVRYLRERLRARDSPLTSGAGETSNGPEVAEENDEDGENDE